MTSDFIKCELCDIPMLQIDLKIIDVNGIKKKLCYECQVVWYESKVVKRTKTKKPKCVDGTMAHNWVVVSELMGEVGTCGRCGKIWKVPSPNKTAWDLAHSKREKSILKDLLNERQ